MSLPSRSAEAIISSLADTFEGLPAELRKAARYVTANPDEVAFRSMRAVAKHAGVSPATMIRLARALDLGNFGELRRAFQARLQARPASVLARARKAGATQPESRRANAIRRVIDEELAGIHACIEDLRDSDVEKAARLFAGARRVYVLGLRGIYPAAFQFHYAATMFTDKTILVDGGGGTHLDALRTAGSKDVALVFTCRPYPGEVLRALRFLRRRRAKIVAVTDGVLSPAARAATLTFNVPPAGAALLSAAVANVLVSRVLGAAFLAVHGPGAAAMLRRTDDQFSAFAVYDRDDASGAGG
ncbi:MAG: MurR/RpiR family transcriptional regulator [Burkholderiales bacterium]|nr:MurR/RpiR family transcriptional regulator [Burkholderiales bacterium]